jgi:hypothetical protein
MLVRVIRSTSSSNLGGATFASFSVTKRSITMAKAKMEQAIRGQIGQPAACMIENK